MDSVTVLRHYSVGVSLGDVGAELRQIVQELATARTATTGLAGTLSSAQDRVLHLAHGSRHALLQRTQAQLARAVECLGEAATLADTARAGLREYLRDTGMLGSSAEPTAAQPAAGPPVPTDHDTVVEAARTALPRGLRGGQTQGAWIAADGQRHELSSGKDDQWYQKAKQFAAGFPPALRAASRLAVHLETKFAVRMREEGRLRETIVIDRGVCGNGATDRGLPFTCDRLLSRFLPPGAELTVVERDGARRTYRGESPP